MNRAFSAGEFFGACVLGRRLACPRLVWLTPLASLRPVIFGCSMGFSNRKRKSQIKKIQLKLISAFPISIFCFCHNPTQTAISSLGLQYHPATAANQRGRVNPREFLPSSPIAPRTSLKGGFPTLEPACPNDV